MKTGILAFCGSKAAGKSTSAMLFKEIFLGPTEEIAFAQHLKNVCSEVFQIDMKNFTEPELKEKELENYAMLGKSQIEAIFKRFDVESFDFDRNVRPNIGQVFDTPRRLLQYVGTDLLHPIDPLIHAKITMKYKNPNALSIVTDLRFLEEFNFLKSAPEFIPVYVSNSKAELAASSDMHKSEKELLLFKSQCELLDNNGNLVQLRKNLEKVVSQFYN